MARRDGWGGDNPVQADFDYLRSFLSGDWEYVGVIVTDPETCESASAWGIESDAREYIEEMTRELIDEIESRRAEHEATLDAAIAGL